MPDTPLNPDALEAAARAANEEGWTCFEGSGEPGNFDTCEDCQRVDKEHANAIVSAYLAVAQPEVNSAVEAFINQRPEYITALKNTRGTDGQSDYHRWQGGAEARRQLAQALGWTVPHNPGETTRPEVNDA